MSAIGGVAVRVLVIVVAVALLWSLSLLVGSQEEGSVTLEAPPAGTERAVPGGAPAPSQDAPVSGPVPAPDPAPAPEPPPED